MTDRARSRLLGTMTATANAQRRAALFRELFAADAAYIHRPLLRLGVLAADAEDVMHDVFISAYEHLDELDTSRSARPWLAGIAFYAASNYRRHAKVRATMPDTVVELASVAGSADPEADLERRRRQATVLAALQTIGNLEQRQVFIMHDIDGMSMTEIAAALSILPNTGYSRLRLARDQFRDALDRLAKGETA
ncbi:MAG: sigma-70 family RNA polymerase sigma factor [Myxococcales bacterium]|nr:sigma-70 family RNA polymerase sigma factor [Myxococcales bacterium]